MRVHELTNDASTVSKATDARQDVSSRNAFAKNMVRVLAVGGILGIVIWVIAQQPRDAIAVLQQANWPLLGWSLVFLMCSLAFFAYAVKLNLASLGYPVTFQKAACAFFLSQPGKYVPGKALLFVIRSRIYYSFGVTPRVIAISLLLEIFCLVGGAVLLVLIFLPWIRLGTDSPGFMVVSAMGMTAGIVFFPSVVRRLIAKQIGSSESRVSDLITRPVMLRTIAVNLIGWIGVGLSFVVLVHAFESIPTGQLPDMIVSYPIAYLVGFFVLVAPAGLGVRELTLAGLLTPSFGATESATIAVVARVWWTLGEGLCCLIAWYAYYVRIAPASKQRDAS